MKPGEGLTEEQVRAALGQASGGLTEEQVRALGAKPSERWPQVSPEEPLTGAPPMPLLGPMREDVTPADVEEAIALSYLTPQERLGRDVGAIRAHMLGAEVQRDPARAALALSRRTGLPPEAMRGVVDETIKQVQTARAEAQLARLPKLAAWAAQSPEHGAAIKDEINKWGLLEWLFGRDPSIDKKDPDPYEDGSVFFMGMRPSSALMRAFPNVQSPEYEPPGWWLAYGKTAYGMVQNIKNFVPSFVGMFAGVEEISEESGGMPTPAAREAQKSEVNQRLQVRDVAEAPIPGEFNLLRHANNMVGMLPLTAAAVIHPAAAFGLMYADSAGRIYDDLKIQGWEEQAAASMSQYIGFTSAAIVSAAAPLFKFTTNSFGKIPLHNLVLPYARNLPTGHSAAEAAMRRAMAHPVVSDVIKEFGSNFAATMFALTAQVGMESHLIEKYTSINNGRPYEEARVTAAMGRTLQSWFELLPFSVIPAYRGYREQVQRAKSYQESTAGRIVGVQDARIQLMNDVYNKWEDTGRALRSLADASKYVAAAEQLRESDFAKKYPDEARDLARQLLGPTKSQSVFVDVGALLGMSQESLAALGPLDMSYGQLTGHVPVSALDVLMHPESGDLVQHLAGEPDLVSMAEARKVNLQDPFEAMLKLIEETKRVGAMSPEDYARFSETLRRAPYVLFGERTPAPRVGAAEPAAKERQTYAQWATEVIERAPTGELAARQEVAQQRAEAANKALYERQQAALTKSAVNQEPADLRVEQEGLRLRRQAVGNEALAKVAQKLQREVEGISKGFERLASKEKDQFGADARTRAWLAGPEYGQAFDAILEALVLSRVRGHAAGSLSDIYQHLAETGKLRSRKGEAPLLGWDLKATNQAIEQRGTIAERNVKELRELYDAMSQISAAADEVNKASVHGTRMGLEAVTAQVAEHMEKVARLSPERQEKIREQRTGILASMLQPHTIFFKLGPVGDDIWFNGFVAGRAKEERLLKQAREIREQVLQSMPKELRAAGQDLVPDLFGNGDVPRSNVWRLALHLGTRGTDAHIAKSHGLEPRQLHEWVEKYSGRTPAQAHEVMDKIVTPHWKLFEILWSEYQEHFKKRGLAPPEQLEPGKIFLHGKEYTGSYGGRLEFFDPKGTRKILHPGSLEALLKREAFGPGTYAPHLWERDPKGGGLVDLDWAGVESSIRREIHDIGMRPFVEDAHALFSDKDFRDLLNSTIGPDEVNQIYDPRRESDFLHAVARGGVDHTQIGPVTRFMLKAQGWAAYSVFSLNFRVMGGQLSHIPAFMLGRGINPMHVAIGMQRAMSPEARAQAQAASETLRLIHERSGERMDDLTREITGVGPPRGPVSTEVNKLDRALWHGMSSYLAHSIWEAAYAKASHKWQTGGEGMPHEEAVRYADREVTLMMPPQDAFAQSAFSRDPHVAAFLFMVRNFPNTLFNIGAMNWWDARVSDQPGDRAAASAKFVGMVLAAEVIGKGLIMQGGPSIRERDPEEWWQVNAAASLGYPFMLSEPIKAAWHVWADRDFQAGYREWSRLSPAGVTLASQLMADVGRLIHEGKEDDALKAAARLLGVLRKTPIPKVGFDLYNAAQHGDGPADTAKKVMGYRE